MTEPKPLETQQQDSAMEDAPMGKQDEGSRKRKLEETRETTKSEETKDVPPTSEHVTTAINEATPSQDAIGAAASIPNEVAKSKNEEPAPAVPGTPPSKQVPVAPPGSSNPYKSLKYCLVTNDGAHDSLVKLIGLKSLFSKQLPKMPRPYIARLVFDRRHKSLAILSDDPLHKGGDEEIIGGICYRGFNDMRFAEIAFCAVNASHQVKGYGTKLMNLLKQHAVTEGIEYFITFADNFAVGYFQKQGFTKNIAMPKGRYKGLIKEYDGGTLMECYVHPSIDYTRIPEMLQAQREFILDRIRLRAKSHKVVYDPLPSKVHPSLGGVSRASETAARAMAIPGVAEAGWTMADLLQSTGASKDADRQKYALKSELRNLVRKVEEQQFAWPFREPVDTEEVKDYLLVVKSPIDLSTIDKRIRKGDWYKSKQMLFADLMLMVNNCKLYNDESSTYYECADKLEKYVRGIYPQE